MFAGFHPEAWWDLDEAKKSLEGIDSNLTPRNVSEEVEINSSDFASHSKDPSVI